MCSFELLEAGESAGAPRFGLLRQKPSPFDPGLEFDDLLFLLVSSFLEGQRALQLLLHLLPELSELLEARREARAVFVDNGLGSLPSGLSFLQARVVFAARFRAGSMSVAGTMPMPMPMPVVPVSVSVALRALGRRRRSRRCVGSGRAFGSFSVREGCPRGEAEHERPWGSTHRPRAGHARLLWSSGLCEPAFPWFFRAFEGVRCVRISALVRRSAMKVAVVMGGPSAEAEVSRVSARAIMGALAERGYVAEAIELNEKVAAELLSFAPDVVFPIAHGALGEDGCLQGLLEILGLPYVGSGVLASAVAADKAHTKKLYRGARLPVAEEWLLTRAELERVARDPESFYGEALSRLGPEMIVKPNTGGSAVGTTRLLRGFSKEELARAVELSSRVSEETLLETYFRGSELTCGVLERDGVPVALPPTLIHQQVSGWYDFESKYKSGGSRHECPAPFAPEILSAIQEAALTAHRVIGARDLSRTDFLLSGSEFIVLETNMLPGMTPVSLFPEAAQAFGIPFAELIDGLVRTAASRKPARPGEVPAFPS